MRLRTYYARCFDLVVHMLVVASVLVFLVGTEQQGIAQSSTGDGFIVVQALGYRGLDLSPYGIPQAALVWQRQIFTSCSDQKLTDTSKLAPQLNRQSPIPIILDVECWNLIDRPASYNDAVPKLRRVLSAVRQARPEKQYGIFSTVPPSFNYTANALESPAFQRKWSAIVRDEARDLAPHVDAVFPALYTLSNDRSAWQSYARLELQAARQFNKPVYCFLWPQFYIAGKRGPYLDGSFWRMELDTCRQYADGIVLYDEPGNRTWDPNAAWWRETQAFVNNLSK